MAKNFFEMKPTFADGKNYSGFRRTWLDLWLNVKSKVKESLLAQAIKQVSGSFLVSFEQDVGAIFPIWEETCMQQKVSAGIDS